MKTISLLLIFLVTTINAQIDTSHNFNLSESLNVNYQQIFKAQNITAEAFKSEIIKQTNIKNVEINDNTITGQIVDLKVNKTEDGPATPIFLREDFNADFTIEFKDNKYRVTITNIVFIDRQSLLAYNSDNAEVLKTNIEDLVVKKKKQKFKTSKTIDAALNYTNLHLTKLFTYKQTKDDW